MKLNLYRIGQRLMQAFSLLPPTTPRTPEVDAIELPTAMLRTKLTCLSNGQYFTSTFFV